eukprot:1788635-Karenia_brevis.AAC.1
MFGAKRFLEVVAGSCNLSISLSRKGIQCNSFEITRNQEEDVTSAKDTSYIIDSIVSRKAGCIWLALPCASFSRARRGNPHKRGFPPPLRGGDEVTIWGVQNL